MFCLIAGKAPRDEGQIVGTKVLPFSDHEGRGRCAAGTPPPHDRTPVVDLIDAMAQAMNTQRARRHLPAGITGILYLIAARSRKGEAFRHQGRCA